MEYLEQMISVGQRGIRFHRLQASLKMLIFDY